MQACQACAAVLQISVLALPVSCPLPLTCMPPTVLLANPFLQVHVLLGTVMSKLLPFVYGKKPALLSLGSQTPYSDIRKAVSRDFAAGVTVLAAVLLYAALKVAHVL